MNAELNRWLAEAQTPETRARIRRLARTVRVFRALTFLSAGACVLALIGVVLAAFVGIFVPAFHVVADAPGWIGPIVAGIVMALLLAWCVTWFRLEAARYADGREAAGTITEVVAGEDSEGQPQYRLTITADLPEGGTIRRTEWVSESTAPLPGQSVRFRHNTSEADNLDDILFLELLVPGQIPRGDTSA